MIREFSAGGVVVRNFRGRPFAAVVQVREGVLALPKGHPDGDESAADAALREVSEETGVQAELVEKLGDIRYWYMRDGREETVVPVRFVPLVPDEPGAPAPTEDDPPEEPEP